MSSTLPFLFSMRGLTYQTGLDAIRLAADTAQNSIDDEAARKQQELDAYNASPEFVGEREDGHTLWELDQVLEMDIERLGEALPELRRAFVLSAYHYWETSVYRWHHQTHGTNAKKKLGPHNDLTKEIYELGRIEPDMSFALHPELEAVSKLANIIKHTSADSWNWLQKHGPQVLQSLLPMPPAVPTPQSPVILTRKQLDWVFDVVRQSGPIVVPPWNTLKRNTNA